MAVRHLSIDIETYSSVNLLKSGLYKYAQSPDFQVLLMAYSVDGLAPAVLDLAGGDTIPDNLLIALRDPDCAKHAYNAAFEWYCLSQALGEIPLDQWRCTMLHGLYCGYPGSLATVGSALGLPADKQKQRIGRDLIRYFCVPCKPTKANGGRTRNLPHHDPDKWKLFIDYCRQDVVTELAVENRLSNFPVPDGIQREWVLDQQITVRGVGVDTELMGAAIRCGETVKASLTAEAVQLTGVNNPGSVQQLSRWLEQEIEEEITDLRKDTVKELLGRDIGSDAARRVLEIRQELGKTSTKKYNAMEAAICNDGRVRGMLQYYGANRTGRWAGRIVQLQNLPRTYLEPLDLARDWVKGQKLDALRLMYGSIPDTLSQLIRTAFVPSPGMVFVDADFSAIEARVIAWLAGEQWRMDVFRTHGKIYEASASQMFGVPIEKIKKGNPEYSLRQKGKVAELALGYQGSTGALIQMGALKMGLTEEELPDIVDRWRRSNNRIRDLWYSMESAALSTVKSGAPTGIRGLYFAREYDPENSLDFLTITLPSGRKLYYAKPYLTTNQWGNESLGHYGMNQTTKKWEAIETYGGKLVENCVQAIARDCLAEAVTRLEAAGYPVVFHVHDEVVLEVPETDADLDKVVEIMSQPMPWAPDLPLGADGWIGKYYRKD